MLKHNASTAAACTLVLLLAYPLSSGPVLLLMEKGSLSPNLCETIYWPLDPLLKIPGFIDVRDWYFRLWDPHFGYVALPSPALKAAPPAKSGKP